MILLNSYINLTEEQYMYFIHWSHKNDIHVIYAQFINYITNLKEELYLME